MEDIFKWTIPKEIHHLQKQHSVNTTKETLTGESSPAKTEEGEFRKILQPLMSWKSVKLAGEIKLNKQCTSHVQQADPVKVMMH